MIFNELSERKQDFKKKRLEFFQNIFIKKLNYDKKINHNKSESKAIKKNISEINNQNESTFKHYLKVEKELIEYIARLNTKIYPITKINDEIKKTNNNIHEMLEYLKRKRLKILQENKNELEVVLYNYQEKIDKERTKEIISKYKKDVELFENAGKIIKEIEESLPKYKRLESDCQKLENINSRLRIKYDTLKIEQKSLLCIINKYKGKKSSKNTVLFRNNSCIFKSKMLNKSNFEKLNVSKIKKDLNNTKNNNHFKNTKIFISQKHSNYSKLFSNNDLPKNRCSSAKLNNRYNIDNVIEDNYENQSIKNQYIIKKMNELNYLVANKYKELSDFCAKEIKLQNSIRNLIQLCVEDLNNKYKSEKKIKNKKSLEEKIFMLSYLYDNCLNNGELKELKNQYSIFVPKKNN